MAIKVGDIVWSNSPNCCKNQLGEKEGFTGKLLSKSGKNYKISVDMKKYPDYGGSEEYKPGYRYIYCYKISPIKLEDNIYDLWI